jgi:signal transduction histidine kinase
MAKDYLLESNPSGRTKDQLKHTDSYDIYSNFDSRIESRYVDLIGNLIDGDVILIRTNLESMKESVETANKLLAYVGIISVLIASVIMFYVSRRFTKPILKLADISKKMSDLNFEIKYPVTTNDEIGELGGSINILSEKLEKSFTELKNANNELLTDLQNKIQIDEMRKDFLSNVTHELKTPIALIQGYAEGLSDNINEDADSREFYCEVIIDEAKKMNQMVKKLLSLNQIEAGNNQVNIERFDLVALIRSVLSSTEILFHQKEIILHFEHTAPVYVWSDEYMTEEVVTNYISNALNHVDGAKIIEIKLIRHDGVVRVAVFNTGANIPEEDIENIWIKFYKIDKARTREYGGSGIGLSIVKAIMTSLNQKYGVINHGTGVEFWFELDAKNN